MAVSVGMSACVSTGHAKKDIAHANMQLGTEYLQQGQLDLAKDYLEKAVNADPDSPAAQAMLAVLYSRLGRDALAEQHYRKAVDVVSEDAADYGMVHNNFGTYLCDHARFAEANAQFVEAAKNRLYESPEAAYENAGLCALKAGLPQEAESHFREALAIRPNLARPLFQMAQIHYDTRRYLLARAFMQRFLAAATETSASLWWGLQIDKAWGDKDAVQRYASALRSRFPDSDETIKLDKSN